MMNMQYNSHIEGAKLTEIEVDGVDRRDYPDFVDAYVVSCLIDGVEASESALEYINDRMPWVAQEAALKAAFW